MKRSGLLLLGGAAAIGILAYRKWKVQESVKLFQYAPAGIKLKLDGLSLLLTVSLDIYNPNRTSVPIKNIVGNLLFKGARVGVFNNTNPVNINGMEKHRVQLQIRVSAVGVINAIMAKDPALNVNIEGLIDTGMFQVPLKMAYSLKDAISGQPAEIGSLKNLLAKLRGRHKKIFKKIDPVARIKAHRQSKAAQSAPGPAAVASPFRNDHLGFLTAIVVRKLKKRKQKKKAAAAAAAQALPAVQPAAATQVMDWRNYRIFGYPVNINQD